MLKVKLEAEREKVNLKEEMIDVLKKDEIYLQGELTKKDAYYQEQLAKKDANFNGLNLKLMILMQCQK